MLTQEGHLNGATLLVGSGLTRKIQARLESTATDKNTLADMA